MCDVLKASFQTDANRGWTVFLCIKVWTNQPHRASLIAEIIIENGCAMCSVE